MDFLFTDSPSYSFTIIMESFSQIRSTGFSLTSGESLIWRDILETMLSPLHADREITRGPLTIFKSWAWALSVVSYDLISGIPHW